MCLNNWYKICEIEIIFIARKSLREIKPFLYPFCVQTFIKRLNDQGGTGITLWNKKEHSPHIIRNQLLLQSLRRRFTHGRARDSDHTILTLFNYIFCSLWVGRWSVLSNHFIRWIFIRYKLTLINKNVCFCSPAITLMLNDRLRIY